MYICIQIFSKVRIKIEVQVQKQLTLIIMLEYINDLAFELLPTNKH
jgi:hypothetical protein